MTEEQLLSKVVDIATDAPAVLQIPVKPKNRLEKLLIKWGVIPAKKKLEMTGATLATMARISVELLKLKRVEKDENMISYHIDHLAANADKVAYIIALAIHNKKGEPSRNLIDFLNHNLDAEDFQDIMLLVIEKLKLKAFTSTITLIQRVNILKEVSPADEEEKIAPQISGEQLEGLANIFGGAEIMHSGK